MDVRPAARHSSSEQSILEDTRHMLPVRTMEQDVRNSLIPDVIQAEQTLVHVHLSRSTFRVPLLSSECYDMTVFPASLEALLAFPLGVSHVTIDDVPDISGSDPKVSTALLIQEISDS